jgi:CheY-like chemotaxis protein
MPDRGKRADVLVIDDDSSMRHLVTDLLEREGRRVATASNVPQALEYLQRWPRPLVIVLGLHLEAKEGWRFLACRLQRRALAAIPVVAMSAAGAGPSLRSPALALGANDFVEKPVDDRDLCVVIERYSPARTMLA